MLITGLTGVGKSYLASALGQAGCRRGLRVMYRRLPRLFEELALAKADGTYARTLGRLAQAEVLVLDDLGIGTVKEPQRNDLLEVLENRYGKSSTVVTSQLPIAKWHEWIGDATAADAILDRLVHNVYKIELKGPSQAAQLGIGSLSQVKDFTDEILAQVDHAGARAALGAIIDQVRLFLDAWSASRSRASIGTTIRDDLIPSSSEACAADSLLPSSRTLASSAQK